MELVLADDDNDDCYFFKEALEELAIASNIKIFNDGVQLMQYLLQEGTPVPDALFLDLNMPRKNGMECLFEIKQHESLKQLPVIIFTTSFNREITTRLQQLGATYCIRKPAEFDHLKKILNKTLMLLFAGEDEKAKEDFILSLE